MPNGKISTQVGAMLRTTIAIQIGAFCVSVSW